MRRILLAVFAVFVAWTALDFAIDALVLSGAYTGEALRWRLELEMDLWHMHAAVLAASVSFVLVYVLLVSDRSWNKCLLYGILYGVGAGLSTGFGSYAATELPHDVALWGALGRLIEGVVAGVLTAMIVKKEQRPRHWSPFGIRERGDYIKY